MTVQPTNFEDEREALWARARTRIDSAFQSTGSVDIGPSAAITQSGQYHGNRIDYPHSQYASTPYSPIPYSPIVPGTTGSGLTPTFSRFGGTSNVHILESPSTKNLGSHWNDYRVDGLPGAELSSFSLQDHHGTQVAHGRVSFDSYWRRPEQAVHSYPLYPPISATTPRRAVAPPWADGMCFESPPRKVADSLDPYAPPLDGSHLKALRTCPQTPYTSVSEGKYSRFQCQDLSDPSTDVVDRSLSSTTNRSRPYSEMISRLPPINVEIANSRLPLRTAHSSTSSEPGTALFTPQNDEIAWKDPFRAAASSFRHRVSDALASPHDQAVYTPQTAIDRQSPWRDAVRTPRTPQGSSMRRPSRACREFNQEQKDFILYLSLQGYRSEAVGLELSRIIGQSSHNTSMDTKSRMMGREVNAFLTSYFESESKSRHTDDDAEKIVTELMTRAEREGWNEGPLSRTREYSDCLARGKSIASDNKERRYEARCRSAYKKWYVNHQDILPQEDGRKINERMAFLGMVLEGTASEEDGPDKEELKNNLLELWESGTIAGKALK